MYTSEALLASSSSHKGACSSDGIATGSMTGACLPAATANGVRPFQSRDRNTFKPGISTKEQPAAHISSRASVAKKECTTERAGGVKVGGGAKTGTGTRLTDVDGLNTGASRRVSDMSKAKGGIDTKLTGVRTDVGGAKSKPSRILTDVSGAKTGTSTRLTGVGTDVGGAIKPCTCTCAVHGAVSHRDACMFCTFLF